MLLIFCTTILGTIPFANPRFQVLIIETEVSANCGYVLTGPSRPLKIGATLQTLLNLEFLASAVFREF